MIEIAPDKTIEIMQEVIDTFLIPKFISLGMNATGEWISSLEAREVEGRGEIWGRDYTEWLNNGRGPNHDKSHESLKRWAAWYGPNVIKPWALAKGLVFDNYFAVAYKIAKDGTERRPERIDFVSVLESKEVTDFIYEKVGIALTTQISEIIKRQLQTTFT